MNHSTPGLPVHHQFPEFTQTHVHRVSDAIQPSHPRSSPSPPAPNPASESFPMSQLFTWGDQSTGVSALASFLPKKSQGWSPSEWSGGVPYFFQFKSEFGNKEFMIWATVSSQSCFCWLYRASQSLAAKNIIKLISVLTIWWCPCIESFFFFNFKIFNSYMRSSLKRVLAMTSAFS